VEVAFLGAYMALRVLAGVLLLAAACYQPRVKNGGYSCKPTDVPACPDGYFCVEGWCLDHPGKLNTTGDLSTFSNHDGDDLSTPGDPEDLASNTPRDFAKEPADLAKQPPDLSPVRDMAQPRDLTPPPDLATGMCAHAGTPCTSDAECCSNTCSASFGNICIGG
jgi:hypothetical protein